MTQASKKKITSSLPLAQNWQAIGIMKERNISDHTKDLQIEQETWNNCLCLGTQQKSSRKKETKHYL